MHQQNGSNKLNYRVYQASLNEDRRIIRDTIETVGLYKSYDTAKEVIDRSYLQTNDKLFWTKSIGGNKR